MECLGGRRDGKGDASVRAREKEREKRGGGGGGGERKRSIRGSSRKNRYVNRFSKSVMKEKMRRYGDT